jgi:hypothetical protein
MTDTIRICNRRFGSPPRRSWWWSDRRDYLKVRTPDWIAHYPDDPLALLFRRSADVFAQGVVVWGHVIQANMRIFDHGDSDLPGEVVYSLAADQDRIDTRRLRGIAERLYALKGTAPHDQELASIAEYLTDEQLRVFGLPVPASICSNASGSGIAGPSIAGPSMACRISTIYFVRDHLPGRRLAGMLLPVVVLPQAPCLALPLPAIYWPKPLLAAWLG